MKKETENWEKDFIGLENMLICLAQEQDNAIGCGDKELSQKLWKEQMGEIRSFVNQLLKREKENRQKELIEIYSMAWQVATNTNQTIGEKHDYYITLWQLEEIIKKFQ